MRDELTDELDNRLMRPLFVKRTAGAMLDARAPLWQPTLLEEIRADEQRRSAQTRYDNACREIRAIVKEFGERMIDVSPMNDPELQRNVDAAFGRVAITYDAD